MASPLGAHAAESPGQAAPREPRPPESRGPLPPALLALALVLEAALHVVLPLATLARGPWRWLGLAPLLVGLALNVTQSRAFERLGTPIHPFARPTALRVAGPYRWTRNPMYLGLVLILAGTALLLGSLSPWVVPPAFAWLLAARFIRREERTLAERFGAEYGAYRARVRRWL